MAGYASTWLQIWIQKLMAMVGYRGENVVQDVDAHDELQILSGTMVWLNFVPDSEDVAQAS